MGQSTLMLRLGRRALLGTLAILATGVRTEAWARKGGAAIRPARAQQSEAPRSQVWTNGVGSQLRPGAHQAGYALGVGIGTTVLGSRQLHDLVLGTARFGWILGGVGGEHRWYRGNPELLLELFGGEQVSPHRRSVYGLTPLLRYNFVTGSRWVPFLNGGVGVANTSIRRPDLSTGFEFNVQVGLGAHYFLTDNRALTVQYRWFHLSNAGMREPNNGTNTEMILAGVDWFY